MGGGKVSDTPRTESFNCYDNGCDNPIHAWGAFSAELERELNSANTIIRQQQLLNEENLRLKERIKMLEVVERLSTAQMDYIQQLETENDAMRADLLLWRESK
jgi:hypothetical protein